MLPTFDETYAHSLEPTPRYLIKYAPVHYLLVLWYLAPSLWELYFQEDFHNRDFSSLPYPYISSRAEK